MNRFVIVDGLPYLLDNGKTYAVRWDENGFTVGAEVKLASVPSITHFELAIKAKCAGCLDSIAKHTEPEQPEQQKGQTEDEPEQPEQPDFDGMTISELKEYAAEKGIDLGTAKKKAEIIEAINKGVIE